MTHVDAVITFSCYAGNQFNDDASNHHDGLTGKRRRAASINKLYYFYRGVIKSSHPINLRP